MSYNKGELAEINFFNFFKENYDSEASRQGGMDCTAPDIISPKMGIIEVKSLPAQCGQFTDTTANNYEFSDEIISAFGISAKLENNELCIKWIKNYYKNHKKVNYFGVIENDNYYLLTIDEFFEKYTFFCTKRAKKSGSAKAAKWVEKYLDPSWVYYRKNDKLYINNSDLIDTVFIGYNTKGSQKDLYINDNLEVRILSNTKNKTYIFSAY